jgi:DNA polymerase-4
LTDVLQESLFPDLQQTLEASDSHQAGPLAVAVEASPAAMSWRIGDDVVHTEHGHGWVQGAGHGVMTVRFETRSTGPGTTRTLPETDPNISRANPVDSLDWPDFVAAMSGTR